MKNRWNHVHLLSKISIFDMFYHLHRKNNWNQFINWKNHPSKTTHVLVFFGGHFSSLVKILLKQFKMAEIHHPPTPLSNTETNNQREPGVPNWDIKWSIWSYIYHCPGVPNWDIKWSTWSYIYHCPGVPNWDIKWSTWSYIYHCPGVPNWDIKWSMWSYIYHCCVLECFQVNYYICMTDMAPQNNVKTSTFRFIKLTNAIVTTNRSEHISHTTHTPCF